MFNFFAATCEEKVSPTNLCHSHVENIQTRLGCDGTCVYGCLDGCEADCTDMCASTCEGGCQGTSQYSCVSCSGNCVSISQIIAK